MFTLGCEQEGLGCDRILDKLEGGVGGAREEEGQGDIGVVRNGKVRNSN